MSSSNLRCEKKKTLKSTILKPSCQATAAAAASHLIDCEAHVSPPFGSLKLQPVFRFPLRAIPVISASSFRVFVGLAGGAAAAAMHCTVAADKLLLLFNVLKSPVTRSFVLSGQAAGMCALVFIFRCVVAFRTGKKCKIIEQSANF